MGTNLSGANLQIHNCEQHDAYAKGVIILSRSCNKALLPKPSFLFFRELLGLLVIQIREEDTAHFIVMLASNILNVELLCDGDPTIETQL